VHFNADVPLGVRWGQVHTFHGVGGLGVCPSNVHDFALGHIEGRQYQRPINIIYPFFIKDV
jgi:hypothetical protein